MPSGIFSWACRGPERRKGYSKHQQSASQTDCREGTQRIMEFKIWIEVMVEDILDGCSFLGELQPTEPILFFRNPKSEARSPSRLSFSFVRFAAHHRSRRFHLYQHLTTEKVDFARYSESKRRVAPTLRVCSPTEVPRRLGTHAREFTSPLTLETSLANRLEPRCGE